MNATSKSARQRGMRVVLVQILLLLLLFTTSAVAQTAPAVKVTVSPAAIADSSKPTPVVLHVTKPDGSAIDAAFKDQLSSVWLAGTNLGFNFDPAKGEISITAPPNLMGVQKVGLFDKAGKSLAEAQLQYPDSISSVSTQIPDRVEDRRDKLMNSYWYYGIVSIMFAGLLIPFGYTIARVIRFSRSSFRNALGFPVGSFRAILAYTLVAYLGFYILTSVLSVSPFHPPEFLLGIVATVVGFYFGSRTGEEGAPDPSAGIVRGIVRVGTNPARGALVKFTRDDGTEPYSRITDLEGHFELRGARPGKYKVTAVLTGSPPSKALDINVSEGSDQEIEIVITSQTSTTPPQTATIQGTVTKAADNSPVEKANVVLTQGSAEKGRATTDAAGKYKIEKVVFGDYDIVASFAGASSDSKPVKVAAASVPPVDLQIKSQGSA